MTAFACMVLALFCAGPIETVDVPTILGSFRDVPRQYSQVPFWFWCGPLDPEQFRGQLREMADKGVYGAMPHPRFGMDRREYLSDRFWDAMAATIDEARKLDMTIWLYDEYNWPSGGAGGRVTDGHPEFYPRGLDYCMVQVSDGPRTVSITRPAPTEPQMERFEKIVRGFIKQAGDPPSRCESWGTVSEDGVSIAGAVPGGQWDVVVFYQCLGRNPSPLDHGSNSMTDYLSDGSVERFIDLTHDAYYERFGETFGRTVLAIFTDEASTTSPAPFPWTERFAERFEARHGRSIVESLPLLLDDDSEAGFEIRMAYWQTVTDLFNEGFIGHVASWCQGHGIGFTGHVYEENLQCYAHSTQLMTILRTMDIPGFDALGPRCPAHGAKVAISVAHLDGKPEALCECLGLAGGWNCTLDTLRTGYNVLGSLGVSRFVPHAFYQTLDNPRIESVPSFFQENPYWKYYRKIAELSSRLAYFNHVGHHVAPCAVYYPAESLWADSVGGKGQNVLPWQHRTVGNDQARQTIEAFNRLVDGLSEHRWDLDVVDDHLLGQSAIRIEDGITKLCIGPEAFRVLIVPPVTAIGARAMAVIDRFLEQGGQVVWMARWPRFTWPLEADQPSGTLSRWFPADKPDPGETRKIGRGRLAFLEANTKSLLSYLDRELGPEVGVTDGLASLRVTHRRTENADLYLLFNDSQEFVVGQVDLGAEGSPTWIDMDSGKAYSGKMEGTGLEVRLRPYQSACVVYSSQSHSLPVWHCDRPRGDRVDISSRWTIQLAGSALDDIWKDSVGDTRVELPVFRVKKRQFSDVGDWMSPEYVDGQWDQIHALRGKALFTDHSSVLLRTALPPGTRAIERPLSVTGEYAVWVNGTLVEKNLGPAGSQQGPIAIGRLVDDSGPDVLAIETYSHSGPAGLTGPIVLTCGPAELDRLQSWQALGFGHYSGRVLYRKQVNVAKTFKRAWLDLGRVEHYVEVYVNGRFVDTLLWPPYEIDITSDLVQGDNEIVLVVANSIANRFAWDVWGTRGEGRAEPSGILGPTNLWLER